MHDKQHVLVYASKGCKKTILSVEVRGVSMCKLRSTEHAFGGLEALFSCMYSIEKSKTIVCLRQQGVSIVPWVCALWPKICPHDPLTTSHVPTVEFEFSCMLEQPSSSSLSTPPQAAQHACFDAPFKSSSIEGRRPQRALCSVALQEFGTDALDDYLQAVTATALSLRLP